MPPVKIEKGGRRTREVEVSLSDEGEAEFEVITEDIPAGLPEQFEGKPIDWFSNFRLKKRAGRQKTNRKIPYSIEFDGQAGDGKYVYYDEELREAVLLPTESAGGNRRRARLDMDDPPIGKV